MDPRTDPARLDSAPPPDGAPAPESIEARIGTVQALAGRLARRLVRDPARADDVAQQAVLAALRRPPRAGWAPVAWLAGVTRNLARKEHRGDARRLRHEQAAARSGTAPSTGDLVARLDEHRALLAAVRSLDEPVRETILLRYFEGMPPREIAASRGLPIATVRSHLRRGLDRLRERLDASHGGDRRVWCVALVPLARGPARLAGPSIGAISAAAAGLLVVVGGAVAFARSAPDPADARVQVLAPGTRGADVVDAQGASTLAAAPSRVASPAPAEGPAWIAGRLTADGAPAAGVRVTATAIDPRRLGFKVATWFQDPEVATTLSTTVSDAEGGFHLDGLAPRDRVRVEALPDGADLGESCLVSPSEVGGAGLLLAIFPASRLRGRLVGRVASEGPATITFQRLAVSTEGHGGHGQSIRVVSRPDAGGRFQVTLAAGAYRATILIPGRLSWTLRSLVAPWKGEQAFELDASGGAALAGTVTDAQKRGIAGARLGVSVAVTDGGSGMFAAVTDEAGKYLLEGIPAGRVVSTWVEAVGFGPLPRESRVTLLASGEIATLDLRLPKEVVVLGRVLDPRGASVAGAAVEVFDQGGYGRVTVRSDVDGRFRVAGLPAEDIYLTARTATGAVTGRLEAPAEGTSVERDLVLEAGQDVTGLVVDAQDHPVRGALVAASSPSVRRRLGVGSEITSSLGFTDVEGRFVLEGLLPADDWAIDARAAGAATVPAHVISVKPGSSAPPVTLRLTRLGAIEGRVVDPDGLGVANAGLDLLGTGLPDLPRAWTRADGTFVFEGVPPGPLVVEVTNVLRERASATAPATVVAGERLRGVELRVEASYLAQGTLTDSGGQPVALRPITLRLENAPIGHFPTAYADTDERGAFQAAGLVPGLYRIGFQNGEAGPTIRAGARGTSLSMPLAGPQWIEGEVWGPTGRPVTAFHLSTWRGADGCIIGSDEQVSGSHFRVRAADGVESAASQSTWALEIADVRGGEGERLEAQPFVVETMPSGPLRIRLQAGRAIVVRLLDEAGAAVVDADVLAFPDATLSPAMANAGLRAWQGVRGLDGAFRCSGLPAGRLRVRVDARAPYLSPAEPIVVEAQGSEVTIHLLRGVGLEGSVVGPDGEPASGFVVRLESVGATVLPGISAVVGADGTFRLEGVPPVERVGLSVSPKDRTDRTLALMATHVRDVVVGPEPVKIRLRRGVFVTGAVVGPDGAVVTRGSVVADLRARARDGDLVFVEDRVDEQGRFRVGPFEPGPLTLFYEGMLLPFAMAKPMALIAPVQGVRLVVARAATLRARVLGAPSECRAWWNPGVGNLGRNGTSVAADGSFALPAAADVPGLVYVASPADDRYALREGLLVGLEPIELALVPGQRIEGRLTGLPAGRAALQSVVARRGDLVLYGRIDPDGTFVIGSVPSGRYRVEIEYGAFAGGVDDISAGATGVTVPAMPR